MNRGLRIGLITVVVIALAYPAAAWVIGMSVQHQVEQREQLEQTQMPYLSVVKRDYRRGVYSSTEEVTYQLAGNWLQSLGVSPNGDKPFQFTVRNHIHHGPLPQLQAIAPATIDTEFVVTPEVQKNLTAAFGDQAHFTIHTRLKWSGGGITVAHSTPFKHDIPNVGMLDWRGLDIQGEMGRELGTEVAELTAPGLTLSTPKGNFAVDAVKMSMDVHLAFEQLAVGKVHFSVGHLTADSVAMPDFKLDGHNITLQADSSVTGDFLTTDLTVALDSVAAGKFSASELIWETRLDHIHGQSASELNKEMMAVQTEQLKAPPPTGPDDSAALQRKAESGQKLLAAFQTHGLQILAHEPVIEFPRIGFKTPDGDLMLSLKLGVPGITPADVSADPKIMALTLPKFLQATFNARVDGPLLDKLLQQAMPESDKSDAVKARLQQLQDQGYIKVDGKALTTQITYMSRQLKINGLPFNPAVMAPPSPPQQTPPERKSPAPKTTRLPH